MGRPRRQEPRRAHLVAAACRVLDRDGLRGLRVREVAAEAGVSPASVLYYYPDFFQLAVRAFDVAVRSLASERAAVAASIPQPERRLPALLDVDLPEVLPGVVRAVGEAPLLIDEHPELLPVLESMLAEQVEVYTAVIADGIASGVFAGAAEARVVARSLVAQLYAVGSLRCGGLLSTARARADLAGALELMLGRAVPAGQVLPEPLATASAELPSAVR